jgi:diguanylate cyclase (GGDEF)-like protein/PAS domain S-box-containing protein
MLGYSEAELKELGIPALTHPEDRTFHVGVHEDLLAGHRSVYELEKRYVHRDGRVIWASVQVGAVHDEQGRVTMLVSQVHDVTAQVQHRQHTQWLVTHDPLTGACNRAGLVAALEKIRPPAALLYLDLDGFTSVNDSQGHASGDRYLVRIADRLHQVVRGTDVVCRLGGDEFVVVVNGCGDPAQATSIAEAVRSAVNHVATELDDPRLVSVSIGVALTGVGSTDEVLARADAALYRAKSAGGDRVEVHGKEA